jgi:pentatricopeptide repeat protein
LQAVNLLQRARNLGIDPNTIMYNTAISALGKSYRWEAAEKLFQLIPCPDTISYETMIAAYGLAGQIEKSESFFTAMLDAGHVPRDYAFCGLIAAYRLIALTKSKIVGQHSPPLHPTKQCYSTLELCVGRSSPPKSKP